MLAGRERVHGSVRRGVGVFVRWNLDDVRRDGGDGVVLVGNYLRRRNRRMRPDGVSSLYAQ
jgi:hypothetical protein